jgi:hypothetical protein
VKKAVCGYSLFNFQYICFHLLEGGDSLNKIFATLLVIVVLVNIIMSVVLYQQSVLLDKQNHIISNLDVKLEDIDEAIEEDIMPLLKEEKN